jgi:hypothetical protein
MCVSGADGFVKINMEEVLSEVVETGFQLDVKISIGNR